MRRHLLATSLALALIAVFPGIALSATGGSNLPVVGSQTGVCTMNLVTGQQHCLSSGPISHLGWAITDQEFLVMPTGPGTLAFSGTWTTTAANGDQLSGTSSGTSSTADGVHFTGVGTWVSTSGTGRFMGASLTMHGTGPITIVSIEGAIATADVGVTIVGRLSY